MSIFVDTSALYALLDADDAHHVVARQTFEGLAGRGAEDPRLRGRRVAGARSRDGTVAKPPAVSSIDLLPVIDVEPVDAALHALALAAYRESNDVRVSFVDRTSFAFMRLHAIEAAFAFDADFARAGLRTLPSEA